MDYKRHCKYHILKICANLQRATEQEHKCTPVIGLCLSTPNGLCLGWSWIITIADHQGCKTSKLDQNTNNDKYNQTSAHTCNPVQHAVGIKNNK